MEEVFSNVAIDKQGDWATFLFAIQQLFVVKRLFNLQCNKKEYHGGRNGFMLYYFSPGGVT